MQLVELLIAEAFSTKIGILSTVLKVINRGFKPTSLTPL